METPLYLQNVNCMCLNEKVNSFNQWVAVHRALHLPQFHVNSDELDVVAFTHCFLEQRLLALISVS